MIEADARRLVSLLRSRELRCRTGIILLSRELIGQEPDFAARLGIDSVDYAELLRRAFSYGTSYVDISSSTERSRLDEVTSDPGSSDCVLIYNVDLAFAKLDVTARQDLWDAVWERLPNRRVALVIAVPKTAGNLLPGAGTLQTWKSSGRVSGLDGSVN
jgi:hypothetical protein